jgi:hypothetical protein
VNWKTGCLIVLIGVGSTQALPSDRLCARVFAALDELSSDMGGETVETATKISVILQVLKQNPPASSKGFSSSYSKLLIKLLGPGKTLHQYLGEPLVWVLKLPRPNEKTVWPTLSDEEKLLLVEELEAAYRMGTYDETIQDSEGPVSLYTISLDNPGKGLSPRLFLANAANGNVSGVCRHTNCALGANLLELGAPLSQVHLVSGKRSANSPSRHLILETKIGNQWVPFDGTPPVRETNSPRRPPTLADRILAPRVDRDRIRQYVQVDTVSRSQFFVPLSPEQAQKAVEDPRTRAVTNTVANMLRKLLQDEP